MFQKLTYEAFDEDFSDTLPTFEIQMIERNNSMGSIQSFQGAVLPAIAEAMVKRATAGN